MDHYRIRRFSTPLAHPMITHTESNPLCGDSITVELIVADGILAETAVYGTGCVMSQASASLLAESIQRKPVAECLQLGESDITLLLGCDIGPVRMRCAMLALEALQKGIHQCSTSNRL